MLRDEQIITKDGEPVNRQIVEVLNRNFQMKILDEIFGEYEV